MNKKIALVLSGGGARGIAHLGILKRLEELGIKPSIISGTSAGAIAGVFYAANYSIEDILKIIAKGDYFNFSNLLFRKRGFYSMKSFEKIYLKYFPNNSFEELHTKVYIAATDIIKGEIIYFSSGNLTKCLMASACIPLLFEPVDYLGSSYVDGGVLNNLPIEPIINQADIIIGVNVNAIELNVKEMNMVDVADRSIHLTLNNTLIEKKKLCNLVLEPPNMCKYRLLDINKLNEIYNYGYQYCKSMDTQLLKLIE